MLSYILCTLLHKLTTQDSKKKKILNRTLARLYDWNQAHKRDCTQHNVQAALTKTERKQGGMAVDTNETTSKKHTRKLKEKSLDNRPQKSLFTFLNSSQGSNASFYRGPQMRRRQIRLPRAASCTERYTIAMCTNIFTISSCAEGRLTGNFIAS